MTKIKVAHVLHSVGGVDVSLRLILQNIDSSKFESIVVHGKNDTKSLFFNQKNNPIRSYSTTIVRNISLIKDFRAFYDTYKILKREQPQIIHTHSAKGGIIGRLIAKMLDIPVLHTPQAFSYLCTQNPLKKQLFLLIERCFTIGKIKLLASSHSELQRGLNEVGFKKEKTLLFNNAINKIIIDKPLCISKTWPDEYICTVGRPSYQKNIELMIDILKAVRVSIDIHLIIMGVGFHSDHLKYVKTKIVQYDLEKNVTLLPWTERQDVFNIISKSKLYISTARYEGLPYSIIEALALSKPCIVTDCDGNRDLIKEGYNGYIINNESINTFSTKISELLTNKQKHKKFSHHAYKSFIDFYNMEDNIVHLEYIYQSEAGL